MIEQAVVLFEVAHALFREKLQPPLHLPHRVAQRVGCQFRLGNDRRVQVGDAFVIADLPDNEIWNLAVTFVGLAGVRAERDHDDKRMQAVNMACRLFVDRMHKLVGTPEGPKQLTPHEGATAAQQIGAAIRPMLAGLEPEVQSSILADLLSIWIAGRAPKEREMVLAMHIALVKDLVPQSEGELFGDAGHPAGNV